MHKYSVLVLLSVQLIYAPFLYATEGIEQLSSASAATAPSLPVPSKVGPGCSESESKEDAVKCCEENNGIWESYEDYPSVEYCLTPEKKLRKEKCLKYNGKWRPKYGVFMGKEPICINNYPDKYKICHRDADCLSNFCITTINKSLENGICTATEAVMCQRENVGFENYKKDIESGKPHNEVFCIE